MMTAKIGVKGGLNTAPLPDLSKHLPEHGLPSVHLNMRDFII